jgi:hypothetical protein
MRSSLFPQICMILVDASDVMLPIHAFLSFLKFLDKESVTNLVNSCFVKSLRYQESCASLKMIIAVSLNYLV